jgi:hypothetical protein
MENFFLKTKSTSSWFPMVFMLMALVAVAGAVVALGACASVGAAARGQTGHALPTGTWGGDHTAVTVTDSGARFEFDCASGRIATPVTVAADGRVSSEGVYVREHSGPVRLDEVPADIPARYTGQLDGQTLVFQLTPSDTKELVGPFTVVRDAAPRVRKCR